MEVGGCALAGLYSVEDGSMIDFVIHIHIVYILSKVKRKLIGKVIEKVQIV